MVRGTDSHKPVLTHSFILPVTYSYMSLIVRRVGWGLLGTLFRGLKKPSQVNTSLSLWLWPYMDVTYMDVKYLTAAHVVSPV